MLSLVNFCFRAMSATFITAMWKNCISHHDESMLHARLSVLKKFYHQDSGSRNSFKIVTSIVHTKSWCYLICPMAEYTPDNVADKH